MASAFPLDPITRVVAPEGPPLGILHKSAAYIALAPISVVLDTLTLFTPAQYWATFGTSVFVFGCLVLVRARRAKYNLAAQDFLRFAGRTLGVTAIVIELILFAPRPMAALRLDDRDLIAVDFHSHTEASHDGRPRFDAERNRAWHTSAGYDVAYITDHRTFAGAAAGASHNPSLAAAGTVLLPGIELRDGGEHVIVLGADPASTHVTSADFRDFVEGRERSATPPLLLLSLPGDISRIPADEWSGNARLAGLEISDGSPRGLAQAAGDRSRIRARATSLRLALVSGSDNHGWGRAAPAWNVLRIPGWRGMSPRVLDDAIRRTILANGPRAVEVVARRRVEPPLFTAASAFTGVEATVLILRSMSWPERESCLVWCWGLALFIRAARFRRGNILSAEEERAPVGDLRPGLEAAAIEIRQ
ncbi:MAG: PHP domain-containing protein [Gemmatimonadaceae bacterium]